MGVTCARTAPAADMCCSPFMHACCCVPMLLLLLLLLCTGAGPAKPPFPPEPQHSESAPYAQPRAVLRCDAAATPRAARHVDSGHPYPTHRAHAGCMSHQSTSVVCSCRQLNV